MAQTSPQKGALHTQLAPSKLGDSGFETNPPRLAARKTGAFLAILIAALVLSVKFKHLTVFS